MQVRSASYQHMQERQRDEITKSVHDFYTAYPYPLLASPFSRFHRSFVKRLVKLWGFDPHNLRGLRLLDAGCGTGEKSVYLASMGAEVTAIDICERQLAYAKRLAEKHSLDIEFKRADILQMALNKRFDGIMCLGVLHHTPDAWEGFAKLCSHLTENGRILLGLYNTYSRVHYRILRTAVRGLHGNDPKEIMRFINTSPLALPLRTASEHTLYDRYAVPYESYHTLGEVRRRFAENDMVIDAISPSTLMNNDLLTQLYWLARGKSFFIVAGHKE